MKSRTCVRGKSAHADGTLIALPEQHAVELETRVHRGSPDPDPRGLSHLLKLVQEEDYDEASRVARELDKAAGPHIEFEGQSFYPEVRKTRGREYVENLYDEHGSGLEAVRALSKLEPGDVPDPEERERLLSHLRRVLDHAVSCGTLLSHVSSLADVEQQKFLAELERYRKLAHKWTELHGSE